MPKYRITTPTGESFEVNAPEGATEQDAIRFVQQGGMSSQESTGLQDRRPVEQTPQTVAPSNDGGVNLAALKQRRPDDFSHIDNIKDSFLGGAVRGARDIVDGGAQLLTRGLEAVAPEGSDFERFMQQERQNVEGINRQAEQEYQQDWRRGVDQGLDPGRIAGNIAATLPFAGAVGPAAALASAPIRTSIGVGAATGALQPVHDTDAFLEDKLGQIGLGAAGGAIAPGLARVLGNTTAGIRTRVANILKKGAQKSPQEQIAAQGISTQGISTQGLTPEMAEEVAKRAAGGGEVNRAALQRLRDFQALGMKPTRGQITRDPEQMRFEFNNRSASRGMTNRLIEQDQQLTGHIEKLRQNMPAAAMDDEMAGRLGIDALSDIDNARKAVVKQNYDAALNSIGASSPLDGKRIIQRIVNDLDNAEMNALGGVPDDIMAAIQREAQRNNGITVGSAEALKKGINARIASADPAGRIPLNKVKDIIDDEISVVGLQAGDDAAAAFRRARGSAAERFDQIKQSPAMERIVKAKDARGSSNLDAVDPAKFIKDMVTKGKPRDLMGLRADLAKERPEVWEQMRGQVVDWLHSQATKGNGFNHKSFTDSLNAIGNAKQKILFNKAELAELKRISRVGKAVQAKDKALDLNYSGSGSAIGNLVKKIPIVGEALHTAGDIPTQLQMYRALRPGADQIATNPAAQLPPELVRALSISSNPALQPFLRPEIQGQ